MKLEQDYTGNLAMIKAIGPPGLKEFADLATALQARPCPFCGGEAAARIGLVYGYAAAVSVYCTGCKIGTRNRQAGTMANGKAYTLQERLLQATELWNCRTGG